MSKRYYIAPVIGSGTDRDPYRLKMPAGINHSAVIDTDPVTGLPRRAFGLAIVAAADHSALTSDAELDAFPNVALNTLLSDLSAAQRNALRNRLGALGIDVTDIPNSATLRAVLRRIGRHLDGGFEEAALDVSE